MYISEKPSPAPKVLVVGAAVLDRLFYVDELPKPGETAIGHSSEIMPGGKGANQALAARKMGAEVVFLSGVGVDEAAELVLEPLEAAGVDTSRVARYESARTAEAIIAVDVQGENQITACPGAYHRFCEDDLKARRELFEWADWLLVQNELAGGTVRCALDLAQEHGVRIVFNPAPFKRGQMAPPVGIEFIVPNEVEAAGMLGVDDYFALNPEEKAAKWAFFSAENVIVTLGSKGGEWFDSAETIHTFHTSVVDAIDTVGAGDAFCGILAAFLAEGIPAEQAIELAHSGAGLSVMKRGAQAGLPTRSELLAAGKIRLQ